jgi:hypothetical protein
MRRSFSLIEARIKRPTAVLLVLWFAGLGCLLSCINRAEAAALHESGASQRAGMLTGDAVSHGHSVEQHHHHDCCHAHTASSKPAGKDTGTRLTTLPVSSGNAQCCPLYATNASGVAHKPRAAGEAAQTPILNAALPLSDMQAQAAPSDNSFSLPNRGHTYLRCCVFLI